MSAITPLTVTGRTRTLYLSAVGPMHARGHLYVSIERSSRRDGKRLRYASICELGPGLRKPKAADYFGELHTESPRLYVGDASIPITLDERRVIEEWLSVALGAATTTRAPS